MGVWFPLLQWAFGFVCYGCNGRLGLFVVVAIGVCCGCNWRLGLFVVGSFLCSRYVSKNETNCRPKFYFSLCIMYVPGTLLSALIFFVSDVI